MVLSSISATVRDDKPRALRPYRVIVLDCSCHTFDDVEIALCRVIPGMTRPKAHQHDWQIHTTGASVWPAPRKNEPSTTRSSSRRAACALRSSRSSRRMAALPRCLGCKIHYPHWGPTGQAQRDSVSRRW